MSAILLILDVGLERVPNKGGWLQQSVHQGGLSREKTDIISSYQLLGVIPGELMQINTQKAEPRK